MKTSLSIVALAVSAGACLAQQADPGVLERMYDHYKGLQGASVELGIRVSSDDPALQGFIEGMNQTSHGYAVKPNHFAFWPKGEAPMGMMTAPKVHSDGATVTSALPTLEIYTTGEVPADFQAMLSSPELGMEQGWMLVPGSNFLYSLMSAQPGEALMTQLSELEYVGVSGEGEDRYHAYSGTDEDGVAIEMRIAAEGDPWLVALKPDLTAQGMPPGFEMLLTFDGWEAVSEAPSGHAVNVEDGWKKVDNLSQAMMEASMSGGAEMGAEEPQQPEPAVGEGDPAPVFSLPLLESEGEFSLAAHRGKVVVLDFWATWCGPCVRGLPTVSGVTREMADKGVVFAAVNLQEQPQKVSQFMDKQDWDFTVPLDQSGEVARSFGVTGIPHTVIIDKQGKIRHVHVGFGNAEETAKRLRSELEALAAE